MKNFTKFLAIVVLGLVFSISAFSQSATGSATATIVSPLTITYDNVPLSFGTLAVMNASAGTVTVSAAGARSSTDVTLLTGVAVSAARFVLTGNATSTYTIGLPASSTITSGANSMTIDGFAHNAIGTIPALGTETFSVGGTLHVGAAQANGSYTGTFNVTVNYN